MGKKHRRCLYLALALAAVMLALNLVRFRATRVWTSLATEPFPRKAAPESVIGQVHTMPPKITDHPPVVSTAVLEHQLITSFSSKLQYVAFSSRKNFAASAVHLTWINQTSPLLAVFRVIPSIRYGTVSFLSEVSQTYVGCEVSTKRCDVDRVASRSMESFRVVPLNEMGHFELQIVGRQDHCAALSQGSCILSVKPCREAPPTFVWSVNAVPKISNKITEQPVMPLMVLATTTSNASKNEMNLKAWSSMDPQIRVFVCVDDVADVELLTRWRIDGSAACEKVHVPGSQRAIPTYRGVFHAAERLAASFGAQWIMFSNIDISFNASELRASVSALNRTKAALPKHTAHLFVTGRRYNCGPKFSQCALFGDDAQDYFLMSVGSFAWTGLDSSHELHSVVAHGRPLRSLIDVPQLVVGAIAFDNWVVAQANKRPDVMAIDGSATITALHLNHGEIRQSHLSSFSKWNSRIAHESGGWARGKTTQLPFSLLWGPGGHVVVHERFTWRHGCTLPHWNQDWTATDPPDAFSMPWNHID